MKSAVTDKYHFMRGVAKRGKPTSNRISVGMPYRFGFLKGFIESNKLEGFKAVALYYDIEKKSVGMQFGRERMEDTFPIYYPNRGIPNRGIRYAAIQARSFFRAFRIDPRKYAGQYEYIRVPHSDGELFVIDLKKKSA